MKVAFDCDGTLLNYNDTLRDEMVRLLVAFIASGAEVVVWTGGGKPRAQTVWNRIRNNPNYSEQLDNLIYTDNVQCMMKDQKLMPDLVFDDEQVGLGKTNICLPPKK